LRRSSAIKKFGTPVSEFAAAGGDADAGGGRGNTVEFLRLELFAIDSPLEGDGFEPSVPGRRDIDFCRGLWPRLITGRGGSQLANSPPRKCQIPFG
jgi:hypothetical protein